VRALQRAEDKIAELEAIVNELESRLTPSANATQSA
jgi:BMFP domain-containing protein YqiC